MASILSMTRAILSGTVFPAVGTTITLASRKTTATYDSRMRLVDTATQYSSATTYTASVQAPTNRDRVAFEAHGINPAYAVNAYLRDTVSVKSGDKLVYDGRTYIVRIANVARLGYRKVVGEGKAEQKVNG